MTDDRGAPGWVAGLAAQGMDAEWSDAGHCWVRFKRVAHVRYPTNDLAPMGDAERRRLLWRHRYAVLQYHAPPDDRPANAWLYLCRDRGYSLDSLSANNRSKVRRGLSRLEVRPVTADEVIRFGYDAYRDTNLRHGVTMMSPTAFEENWRRQAEVPDRETWAAFAGPEMAAFGIVHRCGRWAAISATVSHRDHRDRYPNHALFFRMLEHLMADPTVESTSYGLSSLRSETDRDSLHSFKTSVGFEAVPVRRHVVVHPLLRPAVNPAALAAVRAARRAVPRARGLQGAQAALELLLGRAAPSGDGAGEGP